MYGETIKTIRLNKGLPLKSVYIDVCSKTNAIKFENGERILAVDKFNQVLSNLMITMDEFQWIRNGYKPQKDDYYSYRISKAWNANNLVEFEENVQHAEDDAIGIERIQLASYRLLRSYNNQLEPNKEELESVVNYFSNLSSWTLSDIRFFANNCYLLPYSLMIILLQEVLKAQNRYTFYRNSDFIFAMALSNCIDRMIIEGDVTNAIKNLRLLNNLTIEITMDGFRLLAKYYEAKVTFLYLDEIKGEEELLNVLTTAQFLGNGQLVDEIKGLID
ncbi:hypothetical protein KV134_08440 [Tetragenococcus halophilus]|uniref:Rgg family transcriptional regulator n=1 Tax=Tetragenococcus halophilus TaxID=51669 RepID=UPI000CC4F545|nr:hypothetical protein [Tetragenococcus halophilus]MCO7027034.1 hypothetical protein [Tetragenococcus halophilus]NRR75055.1 hypothetical protein [Tetragenococcus halophilus]NWO00916.1 hypothetical protein [Tetragenococcus halophilus]QXN86238.1 hypothetical protein KV134_08440 [Tetragenococcus halophilus]WJS81324.1 hypothetical protein KFZ55_08555 [Tetragenococcus halophilus]